MDNTYTNIFLFLVITLIYFILAKPKLPVEALYNEEAYKTYSKASQLMLAIYFIIVILLQFFLNSVSIVQQCGGSVSQNMGIAAMTTFLPWFFFMGLVMVCLLVFPGWKSAFADVIGYFVVANSANKLLSNLLVDSSISSQMNRVGNDATSLAPINPINPILPVQEGNTGMMGGGKQEMEDAATAIVKMVGNMSILINQITPDNFVKWWGILKPLMKDKYQQMSDTSGELYDMKQKLLALVVTRDNVGEAFWYIYTAILLISIVQLKIATQGCMKDAAAMQSSVDDVMNSSQQASDKATKGVKYTA